MINEPVLHRRTRLIVDQILKRPSHAILITGLAKSGKHYLVSHIDSILLKQASVDPSQYQFQTINIFPSDTGVIPIDQIRDIYRQVRDMQATLKIINVFDAQSMGEEAQNALLKILEEPPANVIFIMTADSADSLLRTIVSRSQIIPIIAIDQDKMIQHLTKQFPLDSTEEIQLAALKSSGRISSAISILSNKTDDMTDVAKQLLVAPLGDRLILAQKYVQSRDLAINLLEALLLIAQAAMHSSASKEQGAQTTAWSQRIGIIDTALARFKRHANPKIQLLNVLYSL